MYFSYPSGSGIMGRRRDKQSRLWCWVFSLLSRGEGGSVVFAGRSQEARDAPLPPREARLWAVDEQITQTPWTWGARAVARTKPGSESLPSVEREMLPFAGWLVLLARKGNEHGYGTTRNDKETKEIVRSMSDTEAARTRRS